MPRKLTHRLKRERIARSLADTGTSLILLCVHTNQKADWVSLHIQEAIHDLTKLKARLDKVSADEATSEEKTR